MNKILTTITVIIILLIIGIPSYLNISKNHEKKLISVTENRIKEKALDCFLDEVCTGDYTTLDYLYTKNYLNKEYHPITKKYYNVNSKIEYKDKKIILHLS